MVVGCPRRSRVVFSLFTSQIEADTLGVFLDELKEYRGLMVGCT